MEFFLEKTPTISRKKAIFPKFYPFYGNFYTFCTKVPKIVQKYPKFFGRPLIGTKDRFFKLLVLRNYCVKSYDVIVCLCSFSET